MIEAFKKYLKDQFFKAGLIVATPAGLPGTILNESLRTIFRERLVDCVIDVGANTGQYRDFLRDTLQYRGLIISFEPIPRLAAILAQRAKGDKNWHIAPCALGNENAQREFNVMSGSVFSSFHTPAANQIFSGNTTAERIQVTVRRLDDVLEERGIDLGTMKIFIKADTQGHDLEVFRGAPNVMRQAVALQSEVAVVRIYNDAPDLIESITELRSYGFEISTLAPVSFDNGAVVEFDCVMVARKKGR